MPRRIRNWDNTLVKWAVSQVGRPFIWGVTDCVTLWKRALLQMYGESIGPTDRWLTLAEAVAVNDANGGIRQVMVDLGATELESPRYANTGDVLIDVLREGDLFESTLTVVTDKFLFADPEGVISLVPLAHAPPGVTAYRMPYGW